MPIRESRKRGPQAVHIHVQGGAGAKSFFKKVGKFFTSDPVKKIVGQAGRHLVGAVAPQYSGLADGGLKMLGMGRRKKQAGKGRASIASGGGGRKSIAAGGGGRRRR